MITLIDKMKIIYKKKFQRIYIKKKKRNEKLKPEFSDAKKSRGHNFQSFRKNFKFQKILRSSLCQGCHNWSFRKSSGCSLCYLDRASGSDCFPFYYFHGTVVLRTLADVVVIVVMVFVVMVIFVVVMVVKDARVGVIFVPVTKDDPTTDLTLLAGHFHDNTPSWDDILTTEQSDARNREIRDEDFAFSRGSEISQVRL